ncbi:MAG: Clp protease N-terminal domain-containing protein [Pseudomonadota bacterium]
MESGLFEEFGSLPVSPNLATSLRRAVDYARQQNHAEVSLEHLLLSLVEDPDSLRILSASGVEIPRLQSDVSNHLGLIEDHATDDTGELPKVSTELNRILKGAAAASRGRRREIDGAIVLAAIVGDGTSSAAHILSSQGLTFEAAIQAIQTATTAPPPPQDQPSAANVPGGYDAARDPSPATAPPQPGGAPQTAAPQPPPPRRPRNPNEIIAEARSKIIERETSGLSELNINEPSTETASPVTPATPQQAAPIQTAASQQPQDEQTTPRTPDAGPDAEPTGADVLPAPAILNGDVGPAPQDATPATPQAQTGPPLDVNPPTQADRPSNQNEPPPPNPAPTAPPAAARPELPERTAPPGTPANTAATAQTAATETTAAQPPAAQPAAAIADPSTAGRPAARPGYKLPVRPPTSDGIPVSPRPRPIPGVQTDALRAARAQTTQPPQNATTAPPRPAEDQQRAASAGQQPAPSRPAPPPPQNAPQQTGPQGGRPNLSPQTAVPQRPPGRPAIPTPAEPRLPGPGQPPQRSNGVHPPEPTLPQATNQLGPRPSQPPNSTPPQQQKPIGQRPHAPVLRPSFKAELFDPEVLLDAIPERMKSNVPTIIEVSIIRARLAGLTDGSHSYAGVRGSDGSSGLSAVSLRLRAPAGKFFIEQNTPETQWINTFGAAGGEELVTWRWTVTPKSAGRGALQIRANGRSIGSDGITAETNLDGEIADVYASRRWGRGLRSIIWFFMCLAMGAALFAYSGPLQDAVITLLKTNM